jgi:hypothetical protein
LLGSAWELVLGSCLLMSHSHKVGLAYTDGAPSLLATLTGRAAW